MASDLTSSIITPMAAPTNPLTTMGQVQQIINAQSANQLTRQQITNAQTANEEQQQSLTEKRNAFLSGHLLAKSLSPSPQSAEAYDQTFDLAAKLGADPKIVESYRDAFHNAPDDQTRQQMAFRAGQAMAPPQVQQGFVKPDFHFIQSGNQIIPLKVNPPGTPGANVTQPGGQPIDVQVSPESQNTPEKVYDPKANNGAGGYVVMPRGQVPGFGRGAPPIAPFPGNVRPDAPNGQAAPAPNGQSAPGQAPAPNGAANPAPSYAAAEPPPGYYKGLEAEQAQSVEMANNIAASDEDRPNRRANLQDALTELNVPGTFTGPDAARYQRLRARIGQFGIRLDEFADGTAAQDQLEKALARIQSDQMRRMGKLATNEGLDQAIRQSPHESASTLGTKGVVRKLLGNEDAQEVLSRAWKSAELPATQYAKWLNGFTQKTPFQGGVAQFDPRAFWFANMDSSQRRTFAEATPDRAQLARNYNYAVTQGWIKP